MNILKFYKDVTRELRETYAAILVHYVFLLLDNDMSSVYANASNSDNGM